MCADLYTWDYPIQLKMGITIHDAKSLSTNQNIGIFCCWWFQCLNSILVHFLLVGPPLVIYLVRATVSK